MVMKDTSEHGLESAPSPYPSGKFRLISTPGQSEPNGAGRIFFLQYLDNTLN